MKIIKIIATCLTVATTSLTFAMGGTPSAVCYVNGKLVSTNMPVSHCQYQLKGDPSMDISTEKAKKKKEEINK